MELLSDADEMASGHGNVPWAKLLTSPSVILLWVQYFLLSFPWYFYITWLPTYLKEGRHLATDQVATYAIFPLAFGGLGSLVCGVLSNWLAKQTGSVRFTRRAVAVFGFAGAAVLLVVSIKTADPLMAMIFMGLASFCNDLVMPGAWGACMDVGGKYAGTLSGSMNMMGNMAGFVAPTLGGYILKQTGGDWNTFLYVMAGAYVLGTLTWPLIDPVTPLDQKD
ncbi:MAG: MFS transporter [Bryobacteraceae bacterium]